MRGAARALGLVLGVGIAGCATVEVSPPARATAGDRDARAAGHALQLQVSEIALSQDVLVDRATEESRLAVWIDVENRDVVAGQVDIGAARLLVGDGGAARAAAPLASGWGTLPATIEATRALPASVAPGERRRGWVAFAAPADVVNDAGAPPSLTLVVEAEHEHPALVLAAPSGGPRWRRPVSGQLRAALANSVVLGPGAVGDALQFRGTSAIGATAIHFDAGPLVARHNGHAEVGVAGGLQIDLPPRVRPATWLQATPFVALQTAISVPSFPARYRGQNVSLFGVAAGVELGFGRLRPPNADRLPLDYQVPLSPFSVRLAYVRWWGGVDDDLIDAAGRSGLIAGVVASFGP